MNRLAEPFFRVSVALLLTAAVPGLNAQTEVVTVVRGELPIHSQARVVVRDQEGDERLAVPIDTSDSAAHRIRLTDTDTVSCAGDGLWCPVLTTSAGGGVAGRLVLPVFNRTSFRMPVVLPPGEGWVGEKLQVEFWLRSRQSQDHALPSLAQADERFVLEASVDTTDTGLTVGWSGPAGALDFRIAAEGWAPAYLFDIETRPGSVTLPQTKFVRGSSLSAFAVDVETGAGVPDVAVALHLPDAEYEDERARRLRRSETTNDRGFVQLRGIPPGIYDLVLSSEGRPPTHIRDVEMTDGAETWLGNVELLGFAQMTVHVEPATNNGEPWRIEVWQLTEPWTEASATTSSGVSVLRGLVQGQYEVRVIGSRDSLVRSETRWIGSDETVFLSLDLARVRGRVLLGRYGVRSEVDLATGGGDRSRFKTDDEGRFGGSIPRPLQDRVVAFVETEDGIHRTFRLEPRQRSGAYEVLLELGNHGIRGQVLEATSRRPIDGALVMIRRPENEGFYPSELMVDATGSFVFLGLDADNYELTAYRDGYTEARLAGTPAIEMSGPEEVVDTPGPNGVTILLQPGTPLDVLITSADGIPERGANVRVFTLTPEGTGIGETTTDLAGRGQVVVPRSVLPAAVVVQAPSGVLWSGCVVVPEEEQVLHLQLPSAPGGTLLLRRTEPDLGDGLPMPDQDLVSLGGGLLRIQDFLNWTAAVGLPLPSEDTFRVPRVASGHYAVTETLPLGLDAYPAACQGTGRPTGAWEYLPVGGELALPFRFEAVDDGSFWIPG
ncbi:MAG: carboxypeptidase regulatory-like domain-containing protein [Holophagales bacterium]|nr:carboxypeptidase regulatory-like domain-containing protein [Holophagales bacterium]MYD21919.1 carboxypeptidase regulatory-like domain-containing protein [Holophagales bacterium]MYI31884.1 carboxypeptidase regulatory-like domain-containing protein [Holophagales bacterium]